MKRLGKWLVFWSPDDAGGGAADPSPQPSPAGGEGVGGSAAAEGAGTSPQPSPTGEGAGDTKPAGDGKPAEGAGELEPVKLSREHSEEIARLKGVLKQQQDRMKALKGSGSGKVEDPQAQTGKDRADGKAEHPALAGIERSEDGRSVIVDGHEVPPSLITRLYDAEQVAAELKEGRESDEVSLAQRGLDESYDAYQGVIDAAVKQTAAAVFGGYEPADRADVEDWLADTVDGILAKSVKPGAEPSDQAVEDAINTALAAIRKRSAYPTKYQKQGNDAHREANPVKPDGAPGVPGQKSVDQMNRAERKRYDEEVWKQAQARRPAD